MRQEFPLFLLSLPKWRPPERDENGQSTKSLRDSLRWWAAYLNTS
jgi:hypothetical protein